MEDWLVNVDRAHLELFLLTKLAIAFEFFDDEQDAVNSFFPDRALKRFDILKFVQQEAGKWLGSLNPVSKALEWEAMPRLPTVPGRILIVDDDERQRSALAAMLSDCDFETQVAADGQEALERLSYLQRRRHCRGSGHAAHGRL